MLLTSNFESERIGLIGLGVDEGSARESHKDRLDRSETDQGSRTAPRNTRRGHWQSAYHWIFAPLPKKHRHKNDDQHQNAGDREVEECLSELHLGIRKT